MGVKVRAANPKKPWSIIKASKGVVSNASVWDTQSLLPNQDITPKQRDWSSEARQTPQTGSFMHLHLGELLFIYQLFLVTLRYNYKLSRIHLYVNCMSYICVFDSVHADLLLHPGMHSYVSVLHAALSIYSVQFSIAHSICAGGRLPILFNFRLSSSQGSFQVMTALPDQDITGVQLCLPLQSV